jgi:hypothetical protein
VHVDGPHPDRLCGQIAAPTASANADTNTNGPSLAKADLNPAGPAHRDGPGPEEQWRDPASAVQCEWAL